MARLRNAVKVKPAPVEDASLCRSGSIGNKSIEPHKRTWQKYYDDHSRGLRRVLIGGYEQAKANYSCRFCGAYLGCRGCIPDIASAVCYSCNDWANDLSEQVHGRLVKNPEHRAEICKLMDRFGKKQISVTDLQKGIEHMSRVFFVEHKD